MQLTKRTIIIAVIAIACIIAACISAFKDGEASYSEDDLSIPQPKAKKKVVIPEPEPVSQSLAEEVVNADFHL